MWVEVPNEPELKHKSSQYIRQFDHLKPEVNLLPKALGYSYALGPKNQIVEQPKDGSKRSHFFQKLENKLGSNQILSEGIMAAGKLVGNLCFDIRSRS